MKKIFSVCTVLITLCFANAQTTQVLKEGWNMQSSMVASAGGKEISKRSFDAGSWYKITVPSTIIAGLLQNNAYNFDPFYGTNLEKIKDEKFDHSWWFRKTFSLPAAEKNKTVTIRFLGINYKANIWLNGQLIADTQTVKGPFRFFEFDITSLVHFNDENVLAIEVTRPFNPNRKDGDLAIDYADWIHYPADYNGGIVNDVEIKTCNSVAVRYPFVATKFDLPSLDVAHLDAYVELINYSNTAQDVVVKGTINDDVHFKQQVHLNALERKTVSFSYADFQQLNIHDPRIWWPWQYGEPLLNKISFEVTKNDEASDAVSENFGIRQMESKFISDDAREFIVNGKPILLRGAAWSPDIFQRRSPERQEQEIKLVRDMNMNVIRSEGKFEDNNFYDLCDKYGLLVMTGWMCCGAWQYPENWSAAERNVAMSSDSTMMYWLRNKACILMWFNGSDMPPRVQLVESDYLKIENQLKWQNPVLATADASTSKVSGKSGVKMNGPYEWVPPIYWETDPHKNGGAWSFATEISPGPSIPPYESLIKFIPKDSMWYTNSNWLYHCGTMEFGNTKIFDAALNGRYGQSGSIKEYVEKAQAQNYEAHRAMMEAYEINKYHTATGVVQWMLSNPWPGLIWHTYDYYLYPAGTYFGMKKSMETLHVQYSYKSKEVIVSNSLLRSFKNLSVKAEVYNLDGSQKYSTTVNTAVSADDVTRCFAIPAINNLSSTYFLRLQLNDENGNAQSINWYWLSTKDDKLNWNKSEWFYTPQSDYTDFSALQTMPKTNVKMDYTTQSNNTTTTHTITLTNKGNAVAFFVHLRALKNKGGEDILPVIFDDNYLLLAPGETRIIHCSYQNKDAVNAQPRITLTAWNVENNENNQ